MKAALFFMSVIVGGFLATGSGSLYAAKLTVHNDNCAVIFTSHVKVHVYVPSYHDDEIGIYVNVCDDTWVTVDKGSSETIDLMAVDEDVDAWGTIVTCNDYYHEAEGTTGGKNDVDGQVDSSVTCRNDWAGVCQCTKD